MKKLYSVYDSIAGFWQSPQIANNDNDAMRGFIMSCIDPKIPTMFLGDIALYYVADFDELTSEIIAREPKLLIRGNDYMIDRARHSSIMEVSNEISEKEN